MKWIRLILFVCVLLQLWFASAENVYFEHNIFSSMNQKVPDVIDTVFAPKYRINIANESGRQLWNDMISIMEGRSEKCNWLFFFKHQTGKNTIHYCSSTYRFFPQYCNEIEYLKECWQNWFIGACRIDQHDRLIDVFVFVDPLIKDECWWKQYIISQNDSDVYKYIPKFNVLGEDVFMANEESMFYLVAHDSASLYTVDTTVSIIVRPELYNQTEKQ